MRSILFFLQTLFFLVFLIFGLNAQAGPFTDYGENKLIDYLFRGQASGTPSTWYVALYTTCPTDSTAGTEVTGGSYARASVGANALTNWAATQGGTSVSSGTTGTTSNLASIPFPTASASWGVIQCWGLMDASSAGNLWIYAGATGTPTISSGATASFAIGALTVQLDN